jgi:photosystem II stability/assembly factor-like uncharacterized protein
MVNTPWQRVASKTTEAFVAVETDPAGRVWIGGDKGSLLLSVDGARTFARAARAPGRIRGLWCDGRERIVVCADGRIIASDDRGATWAPTSCRGAYNDNLRGCGGALLATNIRSRVLISRDGGVRWTSVQTGWRRYLYSVAANDAGTICAGSERAVVLSRDGGATWRVLPVKHRQYLRGAHVLPSGRFVLVGDEGKVHLGEASGKLTAAHITSRPCLYAVCGTDDELFAVGHLEYAVAVFRSGDGGRTWHAEPIDDTGGDRQLSAVCGTSGGTTVAVGDRGGIWVRR